jgi:hypothetical protein
MNGQIENIVAKRQIKISVEPQNNYGQKQIKK